MCVNMKRLRDHKLTCALSKVNGRIGEGKGGQLYGMLTSCQPYALCSTPDGWLSPPARYFAFQSHVVDD